jgi:hypothetical protein
MLAIIAGICFLLAAFGVETGALNLVWLGLAFLAFHFAYPWAPWGSRDPRVP